MSEFETKILEELQKLNSSFSVKPTNNFKLNFAERLLAEISSLNKSVDMLNKALGSIQHQMLNK